MTQERPHKVINGNKVFLTDDEIEVRLKEEAEWHKEKAKNEYKEKRLLEYGDPREQLDQIFHNFNSWRNRIAQVKSKYPKPGE